MPVGTMRRRVAAPYGNGTQAQPRHGTILRAQAAPAAVQQAQDRRALLGDGWSRLAFFPPGGL